MSDIFEPSDWKERQAAERIVIIADWSDAAKVARSRDLVLASPVCQLVLGKMLGALVWKHGRKNLPFLPPEWRNWEVSP